MAASCDQQQGYQQEEKPPFMGFFNHVRWLHAMAPQITGKQQIFTNSRLFYK
jgi:hypothetical protein